MLIIGRRIYLHPTLMDEAIIQIGRAAVSGDTPLAPEHVPG
jgi:hypothetical protein